MDAACRNLHSRLPHIHARMFRIQQLKQKLLNSGHFPARIIQDQSDEQQLQQMVAKDPNVAHTSLDGASQALA